MKTASNSRGRLTVLGTASRETKGADGLFSDDVLKRHTPGLSNQ